MYPDNCRLLDQCDDCYLRPYPRRVKDEKEKRRIIRIGQQMYYRYLTRSIYTNATTFIMLAVLYVLGVSSIKEFAMPLMVGVLGGTFSSICITGPLWYVMKTRFAKKK
mgnify:CR=1 FL=1